jgi:mycofactocin precursor
MPEVPQAPGPASPSAAADEQEVVELDLLVEEVSIDGMCGVY